MHSIHASSYYLPSTVEKSNDFFLNGASVPQKRHMLLSLDAEQEAKRHVGKCNRCRTEARDSMHGRQGASTASRGALALAAGGNSSGGTQQASRECISAGGRGGFSGWDTAGGQGVYLWVDGARFLDREAPSHSGPHVPVREISAATCAPFLLGFQPNARAWSDPIKACDTTPLNKLKEENKNQIQ